jgi:hypothetical protein
MINPEPATLAAALAALQEQLPRITKKSTGQVGTRTYKYGDLSDIMDAIRDLMISLGLIWVCKPDIRDDGQFVLAYTLRHVVSGEHEDGAMPLPVAGGPQAIGSAITYFRRYALTAVLNIVLEDDDGRAAQDDHDAALQQWQPPARPHTRKADRSSGRQDNDQWAGEPQPVPDDWPGTIGTGQHTAIRELMRELGAKDQADRSAMAMSLLDSDMPVNPVRLSRADADRLIAALRAKKAEVSS